MAFHVLHAASRYGICLALSKPQILAIALKIRGRSRLEPSMVTITRKVQFEAWAGAITPNTLRALETSNKGEPVDIAQRFVAGTCKANSPVET